MHCWGGGAAETALSGMADDGHVTKINHFYNGLKSAHLSYGIRDEMRLAAAKNVIPGWVERAGGPHSDAVHIFSEYVHPIVNVYINPDGSASTEP